jgi:alpha-L-fucosidase 2
VLLADSVALGEQADSLSFSGASELTLYLSADTDYALNPSTGFRGSPPDARISSWLSRALDTGFDALRRRHIEDHASLFGRVDVDFGASSDALRAEPTDVRVRRYRAGADPELVLALFQYGRYLLIASSRSNGLPANLQGLWNQVNDPPWHSDYHTNINIQMNYWLAEPANLPECHEPLFALLDAMLPACRAATRAAFGEDVRGFTYRTSHNIFGGQGWEWNTPASAWYALHYFEHYAFTRDSAFLRDKAFPYLKEVSEFWLQRLKALPGGGLVAPDGWSPEHGPREDGVSYDQQLIWELFEDTLAAGAALGSKDPILPRVASAQQRLVGPKVGRFGQLQEWLTDRDDPDDHHRHTSHLIGVFPGHQINVVTTPDWARAAEVSLRARSDTGDSRRSWTWPWRCALWARLGKPDCHRMIDGYIAHNLLPNLIATHPPPQLDGSFGMTAGICEMLLQSHAGEIQLLPGVDFEFWPNGSFRGLRARGGFELSLRWEAGVPVDGEVLSEAGLPVELRSARPLSRVMDSSGAALALASTPQGSVRFETREGERYTLAFESK